MPHRRTLRDVKLMSQPSGDAPWSTLPPHMVALDAEDAARWQRVTEGTAPLTWDLWAIVVPRATCLPDAGQRVVSEAIGCLRGFFGDEWLDRARDAGRDLVFNMWLSNNVPRVATDLLSVYAHLALFPAEAIADMALSLRHNLEGRSWWHSLLQLEVAGFAMRYGWDVTFEPKLPSGRRADLRVAVPRAPWLVETLSLGDDRESIAATEYFEAVSNALLWLRFQHPGVHATGTTGTPASEEAVGEWMARVREAAAATEQDGADRSLSGPTGGVLSLCKTAPPPGTHLLTGHPTGADEWGRLVARFADKARQTAGASAVWVRIDDLGKLWTGLTTWGQAPLPTKLASLAPAVRQVLAQWPHIDGAVLSHGWAWRTQPDMAHEAYRLSDGNIALRTTLPGHRYRETILVPAREDACPALEHWVTWYGQESSWLDWALSRLGHPPLRTLLADPAAASSPEQGARASSHGQPGTAGPSRRQP